jgi:methionine biosynthesis protein MetW
MRLVPHHAAVLELGCASGYLSAYMEQSLGCRVTGIDFDPAATAIAATRCAEVYTADLDAPYALDVARSSAPYDVLFAAAVLEHLKHAEAVLRTARTLLKPSATVIISLPNIAHWTVRVKLLLGRFDYQEYGIMDKTHVHLYTLATGRALLERTGYTVESIHIAGSGLQNLLVTLLGQTVPLICPSLLAYELIYVAKVS